MYTRRRRGKSGSTCISGCCFCSCLPIFVTWRSTLERKLAVICKVSTGQYRLVSRGVVDGQTLLSSWRTWDRSYEARVRLFPRTKWGTQGSFSEVIKQCEDPEGTTSCYFIPGYLCRLVITTIPWVKQHLRGLDNALSFWKPDACPCSPVFPHSLDFEVNTKRCMLFSYLFNTCFFDSLVIFRMVLATDRSTTHLGECCAKDSEDTLVSPALSHVSI